MGTLSSSPGVRVCFASPSGRPLVDPDCTGGIGGAEVRALTFATAMSLRHRFEILFAVAAPGNLPSRRHGEMQLHYEPRPTPIPRVREMPFGWSWPWRAAAATTQRWRRSLRKRWNRLQPPRVVPSPFYAALDADVYCCFGVHEHAANVIATARAAGKKSVLLLAWENDLSESYCEGSTQRNDYGDVGHLCHFALTHADRIVAQTRTQQLLLEKRFSRHASLIRNPIDLAAAAPTRPPALTHPYVLWVGRAETFHKRAHLCPDLAKRCPDVRFVMILNRHRRGLFEQLVRQAPPNLQIIERVPFHQIDAYFCHAAAFVNTSVVEGFPNTFLQAARFGVPILSLDVDPDQMLSEHDCGAVAGGNLERLAEAVRECSRSAETRQTMSLAGQRYVRTYHDANQRAAELEEVLMELVGNHERLSRCA